jgi:hypothetical protein
MKMNGTRCHPSLRLIHISELALSVAFVILDIPPALANGGKSKVGVYESWESDGIKLSARVEGVLFSLNTAGNKYKVIRLRVANDTVKPLLLSSENDAIEVIFKDQKVKGILDLSRGDPAFWDTLQPEMRKLLIYPESVLPHEEESVFIFIPKEAPANLPEQFRYKINSLSREIFLARPVTAS